MAKVAKAIVGGVLLVVGGIMNAYAPGSGAGVMSFGYSTFHVRGKTGHSWKVAARRVRRQ